MRDRPSLISKWGRLNRNLITHHVRRVQEKWAAQITLRVQNKCFISCLGRETAMGKRLSVTLLPFKWPMEEGRQTFLLPTSRLLRVAGIDCKSTLSKDRAGVGKIRQCVISQGGIWYFICARQFAPPESRRHFIRPLKSTLSRLKFSRPMLFSFPLVSQHRQGGTGEK